MKKETNASGRKDYQDPEHNLSLKKENKTGERFYCKGKEVRGKRENARKEKKSTKKEKAGRRGG